MYSGVSMFRRIDISMCHCIDVFMYLCIYVSMYLCIYVCMHLCMYACCGRGRRSDTVAVYAYGVRVWFTYVAYMYLVYPGVCNKSFRKICGFSAASGPFPIAFRSFSVAFGPFRSLLDQVGPVSDSSGAFWSDFGHSRAISEPPIPEVPRAEDATRTSASGASNPQPTLGPKPPDATANIWVETTQTSKA